MTNKPLTYEQAIEHYTELSRRVQVGAYLDLQIDGSYPPDDGPPESTTLESIDNLEAWARKQDLQFVWNLGSETWSLVKIAYGPEPEDDETGTHPPNCRCAWCSAEE
jgi:hypothetical protein